MKTPQFKITSATDALASAFHINIRFRSRYRAFSLVEMLVSVGILVILASFLFPGIKSMMEKGKSGQCIAQLHQIGVIFKMFESDHGYYAPASFSALGQDVSPVSQAWYQGATGLDEYFNGSGKDDPNNNMSSLAICPVNRGKSDFKLSLMKYAGSPYFCNFNIMVTGASTPVVRVNALNGRQPSSLVLLLDSKNGRGGADSGDFNASGGWPHTKNTSILWVDGHVSQQVPSTLTTREFRFAGQYGGQ